MLDYKDIIIKHYALGMSGREIARTLSVSKTGVNSFLNAFKECKTLSYPLPEGITNYGIASAVYGSHTTVSGRDLTYELPDYEAVAKDMSSRKNMTLGSCEKRVLSYIHLTFECPFKPPIYSKKMGGNIVDVWAPTPGQIMPGPTLKCFTVNGLHNIGVGDVLSVSSQNRWIKIGHVKLPLRICWRNLDCYSRMSNGESGRQRIVRN